MNINNDYHLLYEKMKVNLLLYKESLLKSQTLVNPHTKRIYITLDKFLKDIKTIPDIENRKKQIANTYKWYIQSLKENSKTHKTLRYTNINFYYPFLPNNNNNRTDCENLTNKYNNNNSIHSPIQKNLNFADCFHTTPKHFIFHNTHTRINTISHISNNSLSIKQSNPHQKWFDKNNDNPAQLLNIRSYKSKEQKEKKSFSKENISKNNYYIVKAPICSIKQNKDRIINLDKKEKKNDIEKQIDEMNCTKKKIFKGFKIKKRNFNISRSTAPKKANNSDIIKPNTANALNDKIFDVIRGIRLNINVNNDISSNNVSSIQSDCDRKTFYNESYKLNSNTMDYRKTVSNFKHVELKSLHDYLRSKKRTFNPKALQDAFINPEFKTQSTFYLPHAGSGLLSKPEYLD